MNKKGNLKRQIVVFRNNHPWMINFLTAAIIALLLLWVTKFALDIFTRHGQKYEVPDFSDITLQEAHAMAKAHKVKIVVIDSVSVTHRPRGVVFRQNPKAGMWVKKNRNIFLTVNSTQLRKVEMPNVVGYSIRQAKAVLLSKNLYVGTLNYINDIATNSVLQQRYNGNIIAAGEPIHTESYIDLDLGINPDDRQYTVIPKLLGFTFIEAKNMLVETSLNSGTVYYDDTVKTAVDSLFAKIYRQSPAPSQSNIWALGMSVDLWLTVNDSKTTEQ